MFLNLLITAFLLPGSNAGDSTQEFRKQLGINLMLNLKQPPNSDAGETCYHYTELVKIETNKLSKIISLDVSDSAPDWLKEDLNKRKKDGNLYKKLDSLALKAGLRNRTLVFPLIMESDDFPCGEEKKKRSLNENYFQFGGKNLKGNIIFGKQIEMIFSTRYLY